MNCLLDPSTGFGFGNFPDLNPVLLWAMGCLLILPALSLKPWVVSSVSTEICKTGVYFFLLLIRAYYRKFRKYRKEERREK